jgi:sugar lactone lactonase YvrE
VDPVAYITDSGSGAIVVVDLEKGTGRRTLAGHHSTKAEPGFVPVIEGKELRDASGRVPQIHADGIAIDTEGEYLYYHALTARTLYRIRTSYLKDSTLTEEELGRHVERVAETGAADGMLMDTFGNLYFTALEENAIKRYSPDGKIITIVQAGNIHWPDSMDISADDYLYFTDSQINLMSRFNDGKDRRALPYRYFKIWLEPF